eukprot:IDg16811t1
MAARFLTILSLLLSLPPLLLGVPLPQNEPTEHIPGAYEPPKHADIAIRISGGYEPMQRSKTFKPLSLAAHLFIPGLDADSDAPTANTCPTSLQLQVFHQNDRLKIMFPFGLEAPDGDCPSADELQVEDTSLIS